MATCGDHQLTAYFRAQSGFLHLIPVIRHIEIYSFNCFSESFTLDFLQFISVHALEMPVPDFHIKLTNSILIAGAKLFSHTFINFLFTLLCLKYPEGDLFLTQISPLQVVWCIIFYKNRLLSAIPSHVPLKP